MFGSRYVGREGYSWRRDVLLVLRIVGFTYGTRPVNAGSENWGSVFSKVPQLSRKKAGLSCLLACRYSWRTVGEVEMLWSW